MTDQKKERIGLLGGTFNPPHLGHVDICKYIFDRGDCDRIWVFPCFQHPFGKPAASFEDRLTMCRFNFQDFTDRVWVSDVERRLGGVSHTVRTVNHLRFQYPDKSFALIIGSDISKETDDWKEFEKVQEMVTIIEVPRGENSPITNISSSEIRSKIRSGEKFDQYVATPVAVYIVTHGLYHE